LHDILHICQTITSLFVDTFYHNIFAIDKLCVVKHKTLSFETFKIACLRTALVQRASQTDVAVSWRVWNIQAWHFPHTISRFVDLLIGITTDISSRI